MKGQDARILVAVPNISTADPSVVSAVDPGALDVHRDADHGRTVLTLAGDVVEQVVRLAHGVAERVDLRAHTGLHPHVGALDVAPVVFLDDGRRGAACAAALVLADRLGEEVGLPVFLYGLLAGGRTRAELRRGGVAGLVERGTRPDFGPPRISERSGAVLVAARPPLVAFNFELAVDADPRPIAAAIRGGPVRALGLTLSGGVRQVSCNVEDHRAMPLAALLAQVERHAPVAAAELVGLAPAAAFEGWPERVPIRNRATIEDRLASA